MTTLSPPTSPSTSKATKYIKTIVFYPENKRPIPFIEDGSLLFTLLYNMLIETRTPIFRYPSNSPCYLKSVKVWSGILAEDDHGKNVPVSPKPRPNIEFVSKAHQEYNTLPWLRWEPVSFPMTPPLNGKRCHAHERPLGASPKFNQVKQQKTTS